MSEKNIFGMDLSGVLNLEAIGVLKAPDPEPEPVVTTRTPAQRREYMYTYAQKHGLKGEELALFLGQVEHESGGFSKVIESFNYSIQGLSLFKKYLSDADRARLGRQPGERTVPLARQAEIANRVYGGRMGNTGPNDGWLFRGHGLIQLTGRANHKLFGDAIGVDLVAKPELASDEAHIYDLALAYWVRVVQPAIKRGGLTLLVVTKAINGGTNGLDDRTVQTEVWRKRIQKDAGK